MAQWAPLEERLAQATAAGARNLELVEQMRDFNAEYVKPGLTALEAQPPLEEEHRAIAYFATYMSSKRTPASVRAAPLDACTSDWPPAAHYHFVGEGDETVGPVIVTAEDSDAARVKVLVRLKRGDVRLMLPRKHVRKALAEALPELAPVKLEKAQDPALTAALLDMETKLLERRHKFGVLLCRAGQTNEDQWYQNTELPPDFDAFLNVLGERIALKGWGKYAGGLNTREGHTGTHSVYACHRDIEVMFHVAPLLPYFPEDVQQVERKRHLGNDVCMVIFREEGCTEPFTPLKIRSQFNHVFVVVQPDRSSGALQYRIAVINKLGVAPFGPALPVPGAYDAADTARLRELLLCKLINGERSAMYAPDFKGKNIATRKTYLTRLVQAHDPAKKKP